MAEIGFGEGASRTAARIEVLSPASPYQGPVSLGNVHIYQTAGVVRVLVSLLQGGEAFLSHELWLHDFVISEWLEGLKHLVAGKVPGREVPLGVESPHLHMEARRLKDCFPDEPDFYKLLVCLDSNLFGAGLIAGSGPCVRVFVPDPGELLKFAETLLAEIQAARSLGWLTAPGGTA